MTAALLRTILLATAALGCTVARVAAPPAPTGPTPSEFHQAFYSTYPSLTGREQCVSRVAQSPAISTAGDLALAAVATCIPDPKQWVQIGITKQDRPYYVDGARTFPRGRDQVDTWVLLEQMDGETDFYVGRDVFDCDRRLYGYLSAYRVVNGTRYTVEEHGDTISWQSAGPNSVIEDVLTKVCSVRGELLRDKEDAKKASPKTALKKPSKPSPTSPPEKGKGSSGQQPPIDPTVPLPRRTEI